MSIYINYTVTVTLVGWSRRTLTKTCNLNLVELMNDPFASLLLSSWTDLL